MEPRGVAVAAGNEDASQISERDSTAGRDAKLGKERVTRLRDPTVNKTWEVPGYSSPAPVRMFASYRS